MVTHMSDVKHIAAGTGPAYWGPGDQLRFLITGAETNGAFFMGEATVPPGGGPPPHVHQREDESFYVMQGTLTIQVGERTIQAAAGDLVFLPRGIAHSFKNTGTVMAKLLVTITPAGLENYFASVFDPAADDSTTTPPPNPQFLERALTLAPRYGVVLLPPV
jgi:quercetin dioxygenase-like cupin family protein